METQPAGSIAACQVRQREDGKWTVSLTSSTTTGSEIRHISNGFFFSIHQIIIPIRAKFLMIYLRKFSQYLFFMLLTIKYCGGYQPWMDEYVPHAVHFVMVAEPLERYGLYLMLRMSWPSYSIVLKIYIFDKIIQMYCLNSTSVCWPVVIFYASALTMMPLWK